MYADIAEARAALAILIYSYSEPGNPQHGPYVLAVEHAHTRELLGRVGFSPLDGELEMSCAIAETERGGGFGTEALTHACQWINAAFRLQSILAVTASENVASRRALARARSYSSSGA